MTIAMLSWGAEKTLRHTLDSYVYHDLLSHDDDKVILLQDYTYEQQTIANDYGFRAIPSYDNIGIAQGYRQLVEATKGEYFLFLENDWELLRHPGVSLSFGKHLLLRGEADIIRYRDRENPGNPLWTRQFEGREYDRPSHLLDSIHWTDPSKFSEIKVKYFDYFEVSRLDLVNNEYPIEKKTMEWYLTTSKYANWTNNPHMARTEFLKEHILPRLGGGDLEQDIQSWWQQQDFKVAQSDGLFTHNRLD